MYQMRDILGIAISQTLPRHIAEKLIVDTSSTFAAATQRRRYVSQIGTIRNRKQFPFKRNSDCAPNL